jgi:hypothetical protein
VSSSDVILDRYKGTQCQRTEFKVVGTTLQRRITVYSAPNGYTNDGTDGCYNYSTPGTVVSDSGLQNFIRNIGSASPFAFYDSTGAATTAPARVHTVQVTLQVTLPENRAPISYNTTVTLRNQ